MATTIMELSKTELKDFLELPHAVYRDDPHYCVPFTDSVSKSLLRDSYSGRQRIMLAVENDVIQARLVARVSPTLRDANGKPYGMIGLFESLDNFQAASELLREAVKWLGSENVGEIIGPIDGDTWHTYRFSAGPFDTRPFMMEPYNKPYYCDFWERNGFEPLPFYYSKHIPDSGEVTKKAEKFLTRAEKSGFTFRMIKPDTFVEEMKIIYRLSCDIFSANYLYTPISEADFIDMYTGTKNILTPDFIWFVQDKAGKYAGYLFSFPDYFRAISAMKGQTGLLAKVKFLFKKGDTDTLNIKTLGVIPEYRGAGLAMALMHKAYAAGLAAGFSKVNLCLIRDGNSSGKVDMGTGFVSRKYLLYRFNGSSCIPQTQTQCREVTLKPGCYTVTFIR